MLRHRKPRGRINHPGHRDVVPRHFQAQGTVDSLPAGQHLVLVVEIGALMWPKGKAQVNDGSWTGSIYEGGWPPGGHFMLSLFMVPDRRYGEIAAWLKHGELTGDYPGLAQIGGGVRLHSIRLRLEP